MAAAWQVAFLPWLHERGHFSVARLVGMKPRALYIGFPPALAKVERNGVEYGIGAIPLGGYTRIPGMHRPSASDFETLVSPAVGEDPALRPPANVVRRALESEDRARAALPALNAALGQAQLSSSARRSAGQAVRDVDEGSGADAYWRQPTWNRIAVIAAGPGMNVLVAFVIFFAVYATGAPSSTPSTRVARVEANSPAAAAGLRPGDRIVAVDGRPTRTSARVSILIRGTHGRPITVSVERDGRKLTLGPRRTIKRQGRWIWGFVPASQLVSHPLGESARLAIGDCWQVATGTVAAVRGLFQSRKGAQISGPVGIVRTSEQFLTIGLQWYLQLLGLISMSLALYNLLPLLPLDGGHILISLIEGARRRAVPQRVYQQFSSLGMAVILLITLLAFMNDLGAPAR